jgi:chemotaxis protein MotB
MAKQKKCPDCKKGAAPWLVTYGDMITLMLTFFVALLAFSTISPGKFQEVASGIMRVFSAQPPSVLTGGRTTVSTPIITTHPGIREDLLRIIEDESFKGKITVEETPEGTLIILSDLTFFEPFSARLTAEAKEMLEKIGTIIIEHTTNPLEILGYTDDRLPPEGSIYPSNWHLAGARAASVARYFVEDLKNKRTAERIVDIRSGRFDPDDYYRHARFIPVAKGDVPIQESIRRLDLTYRAELDLLQLKLRDQEITQAQSENRILILREAYQTDLSALRARYQKIEILIKRDRGR